MTTPQAHLGALQRALDDMAQQPLNAQQMPFIQHLHRLTAQASQLLDGLDATEAAQSVIVPELGEPFQQMITAIYGYAKLLLDFPAAFDSAALHQQQRAQLQAIYAPAKALYQQINDSLSQAQTERIQQQTRLPATIDLQTWLLQQRSVLHYYSVQLDFDMVFMPSASVQVITQAYHSAALLRHVVRTLKTEHRGGMVDLFIQPDHAAIALRLVDTRLTQADYDALFKYRGNYHYRRRFQAEGGKIQFFQEDARHTVLRLHFVKAP